MDIEKTSLSERFYVGNLGADAVARSIVNSGQAPQSAFKFVKVRANSDNTIDVYVGRSNVTVDDGFIVGAGEQVEIPTDEPSSVYVVSDPANNSTQTVTVSASAGTFTLTYEGESTSSLDYNALGSVVETALEGLFGAGNVSVTGDGPYVVEFVGALAKTDIASMTGTATDGTVTIEATQASAGSHVSWLVI